MAFEFEKPPGFTFIPGQSVDLILPNPRETDAEGNARAFSLASAPEEGFLMVATRMRGTAFKRELADMPIDGEVEITPPGGSLTLHNNASRTAVFLTGGIGITPFRSILVHAARMKLPHRIILFSSNRRPEDAPFLRELSELQKENENFKFVPTMTNMPASSLTWAGETGKIGKAMMEKHLSGAANPIFYVAGPPEMVNGLQKMLNDSGVDNDDIRTEGFSGY
jgi:ferredoxin-NADP reductase